MNDRAHRIGRVLAIAATATMVATALAGSIAAAANPTACRVTNVDKGISRNSLQRAVWAADAGDRLLVQGTCVGTTVIRKELTIGALRISSAPFGRPGQAVDSGPPTLRSGSWRPTLIIDPAVDDLYVQPIVRQGFVIGDPAAWRGATRATAPRYWTHWGKAHPVLGGQQPGTIDDCAAWNASGQRRYGKLSTAIGDAGDGARFVLAGKCWGWNRIEQRVYVHGSRVPGDSGCRALPNGATSCIDYVDFGPPRVKGPIRISAAVDEVAFKRLSLEGGVRIR